MTAIEAAEALGVELVAFRWLVSVGVGTPDGRETIFVYVKSLPHHELDKLRDGYQGFPVIIKKTGAIRPAIPAKRR